MIELTQLMKDIHIVLNQHLMVSTVALCSGYLKIPLKSKKVQPYIIFRHDDKSVKIFLKIMSELGINMRNVNDFLKASFNQKTLELRWMFLIPESYLEFRSEGDILEFWQHFNAVINSI